jgi:hypothetical protein
MAHGKISKIDRDSAFYDDCHCRRRYGVGDSRGGPHLRPVTPYDWQGGEEAARCHLWALWFLSLSKSGNLAIFASRHHIDDPLPSQKLLRK